jgi:signal peptidase II
MHSSTEIKRRVSIAVVVVVVLVLDQFTKALVTAMVLPLNPKVIIPGLFSIVNVKNPGAAFGILSGGSTLLIVITLAALALIIYLLATTKDLLITLALSLIAGGALGNLVDRVLFSEVLDFLDFHLGSYHWPAFNVGDIAITAGVIVYLVAIFTGRDKAAG